ncbi:MAG: hypothetical protein ACKVG6_02490 [Alphaproteobacteria bacterium]
MPWTRLPYRHGINGASSPVGAICCGLTAHTSITSLKELPQHAAGFGDNCDGMALSIHHDRTILAVNN